MARSRHEIPTHLNVEDKVLYGLSVRQVMYLTVGCAAGYAIWNQWPDLALVIRLGLAVACLALAAAIALVRPHGRGLEEWVFVALHYLAVPKVTVWRPREPDRATSRPTGGRWAELAPRLSWTSARADAAEEDDR
ncbi:MAG: PrgI family protein [Dehalococcoidia bacterium]